MKPHSVRYTVCTTGVLYMLNTTQVYSIVRDAVWTRGIQVDSRIRWDINIPKAGWEHEGEAHRRTGALQQVDARFGQGMGPDTRMERVMQGKKSGESDHATSQFRKNSNMLSSTVQLNVSSSRVSPPGKVKQI